MIHLHRHLLSVSLLITAGCGFAPLAAPLLAAEAATTQVMATAVGVVEQVDLTDATPTAVIGTRVLLRFDRQQGALVLPGGIVGLYAPGAVEKHPLTGQVVVSRPVLRAKAQVTQVIGLEAGQAMAQIRWVAAGDGPAIASGMDALWLPKEPAPNAAPGVITAPAAVSAAESSLATISAPVADVDGDALISAWRLDGPPAACGRLVAESIGGTAIGWLAPARVPGDNRPITAIARVVDGLGQSCEVTIPLTITAAAGWSGRTATPFARWGKGREPALVAVERDASGAWWGISDNGAPLRWSSGWLMTESLSQLPAEQLPRRAIALAVAGDAVHVLDGDRRQVLVYGMDGSVRRTYGDSEAPTDLALGTDGTAFIADQKAGGIHIIETDGSYRGRLGSTGPSTGQFLGLTAVCTDAGGGLHALDQVQHSVTSYDRFQRRLRTRSIPGDAADEPIDVAMHPTRGLLVLYQSGRIVAADGAKGPVEAAQPALGAGIDPGPARRLTIDGLGQVLTTHPQLSLLTRYDAQLRCTGMRGADALTARWWAADGAGRSYGLDAASGAVTVLDAQGWTVRRYDTPATGGGLFSASLAIAVHPRGSAVWVIDAKRHGLHRIDTTTTTTPAFTGGEGDDGGRFGEPVAAACDDAGRVYVLDADTDRVQVLEPNGSYTFSFGTSGKAPGELKDPERIAVDAAGQVVYVYDAYGHELKKFAVDHASRSARHLATGGGKGSGPGQFRTVASFGCDRFGLLHVLDTDRDDWQVIDFRGNSPVVLTAATLTDLGVTTADSLAIAPDGQGLVAGGGALSWFRF